MSEINVEQAVEELGAVKTPVEPWPTEELLDLLRWLAVAFDQGLSLVEFLEGFEEELEGERRDRVHRLRAEIKSGENLSASLSRRGALPVVESLVRAGEMAGCLPQNLRRLFEYLAEEERLASQTQTQEVITEAHLSLWCRLFGLLLQGYVPILSAMEVVANTTAPAALREATLLLRAGVREGGSLGEQMKDYAFFPPLFRRMVRLAEQRGGLDQVLLELANHPEIYRRADGEGYPAELPEPREPVEEPVREAPWEALQEVPAEVRPEDPPIVRIANSILQRAFRDRATDVHIEPSARRLAVRYRVDGVLREIMTAPKYVHAPLVSRFKIMADLNVGEWCVPQRGLIRVRHEGRDYVLRASTYPSIHGEVVSLRIHPPAEATLGLDHLGLSEEDRALCEGLLWSPTGLLVVTGPIGGGRTTTLYALLATLVPQTINVMTVESVVEQRLPGVHQCQVDEKIGLTFPRALRALERQDPDVILVSDLRDADTTRQVVRLALSGHLVLTALSQRDPVAALETLMNLGEEPFPMATSLLGVITQRLVRQTCEHCREAYDPPESERVALRALGVTEEEIQAATFTRGAGCENCRQTGYRGRTGVFEILRMDRDLLRLLTQGASRDQLRTAIQAAGRRTLARDAARKALAGVTTVAEAVRVVGWADQTTR